MTSAMMRGFAKLSSSDDSNKGQTPDKYRLLVTAGPSYDTTQHQIVPVNGGHAITIENDFLRAKIKVRVRGYRGLPSGSPASNPYFDDPVHEKDQYSVAFSFVPKQDLASLDTVWGNDFDHPIRDRLPPGFNTAFKIVKEFIDPGLACDAYADEPWLYGPSLSCWFAFRIGDKFAADQDFPAPDDENVMRDGADGSGAEIRQSLGIPENNEKRRKFYLDANHRKELVFEKGRMYQADFYNPYLDFGNLALKLPGFSLKVYKYIDNKSHCLRYVFKNRQTGDMYVNINFNLLWGQPLEDALAKEKQTAQPESKDLAGSHASQSGAVESQTQDGQESRPASSQAQDERRPQAGTIMSQPQEQQKSSAASQAQEGQNSHSEAIVSQTRDEQESRDAVSQAQEERRQQESTDAVSQTHDEQRRQSKATVPQTQDEQRPQSGAAVWQARHDQSKAQPDSAEAQGQAQRSNSAQEIEKLLASTSTDDRRGVKTSILDVD